MGYSDLRTEIRRRRDALGLSRARVTKILEGMPGCPERLLDQDQIRRLETITVTTPDDLTELRYLCAVVGLPWTEALEIVGGWPEVKR